MSFYKALFCLVTVSVQFCYPASISDFEFPYKCSLSDSECLKSLATDFFQKYKDTGLPELGIPVMDPYKIKNANLTVLHMADFMMTDGLVEGAMSCVVKKFESVFEKDEKYIASETFCDRFKMSGQYKTEFGPLVQTLLGKNVSADGTGFIQIDKMTLKMKIPYEVRQLEDGEIYLIPIAKKAEYSTNDIEKITFNATNVILGGRDVSESLTNFMNNNWKMLNRSFGKIFSDKIMQTFFNYLEHCFSMMPASKFSKDELKDYVKVDMKKNRIILF